MRSAVALTVLAFLALQAGDVSARRRTKPRSKPPATKVGPAGKASSPTAEGKAHLKKANALAGDDNCEAAVKAYTAAYDKLGDPVVLFNRAECYRRLGEIAKAVEDYQDFLEEVPNAPNREDIEAKIAALRKGAPPEPEEPDEPAADRSATAAAPPQAPSQAQPPKDEAKLAAPRIVAAPAEERSSSRIWLWTAVGLLLAGGVAGAYLAFRLGDPTPPVTTFGNYEF